MNKHERFSALLLAALAEGEGGSGGGDGGTGTGAAEAKPSEPAKPADNAGGSGSGSGQSSQQDKSGQRDAATDDPKPTDPPKPTDTSKLEKALASERESRKAAEQAAKDKQAEVDKAAQSHQKLLEDLAVTLGVKKSDTPPDPEALQRAVSERDARIKELEGERDSATQSLSDTIRQQRVELAAWRLGSDPKLGANVAALLDSRRVAESISGLDPAGDSFEKDITAVIKTAVESNPAYRINQAAPAADAGIGATGAKNSDAHVTPGVGRLRAGYGDA